VTNKSKDYEGNPWGWNGAVISCRFRTTPDSKFGKINPTKLGQFRRVRGWLEVASDIDGYARMKTEEGQVRRGSQSSILHPLASNLYMYSPTSQPSYTLSSHTPSTPHAPSVPPLHLLKERLHELVRSTIGEREEEI
jgi:hypothetical protein